MFGVFSLILLSVVAIFANGNSGYTLNPVSDAATNEANISCAAFTSNSTNDQPSNLTDYCTYPSLYSMNTKKCEAFKDVNCGSRREPKTPCEYPNSNCSYPKGGNVSLCTCEDNPDLNYDTCLELEDGDRVWTARRWSPFYITCTSHRTLAKQCCGASVIYNFFENKCENVYEVVNKAYSLSLSLSIPESLFHLVSVRQTHLTPQTSTNSFSDVFVMPTTRFEIHPTSSFKYSVDIEIYSTTKHNDMKSIITNQFETSFERSSVLPSRLSLQTEPSAKYSSDYSEIIFKSATTDPTEKTDSSSTLKEMSISLYEVMSQNSNHTTTSERITHSLSSQDESYYLQKSSPTNRLFTTSRYIVSSNEIPSSRPFSVGDIISVQTATMSPSLMKDLLSSSTIATVSVVLNVSSTTTILSKDLNIYNTDFYSSQTKDSISNSLSEASVLDSSRSFSQLLSNATLTETSPLYTSSTTKSNSSLAPFSGESNPTTSKPLVSHSSGSSQSDAFNTLPDLVSFNNKLSPTAESMSFSSNSKYSVSDSIPISPQSRVIRSGNIDILSTSSSSFLRDNLETYLPTVSFTQTSFTPFLTSVNTQIRISYSNTNLMVDASLATVSLDSYSAFETEFSTLLSFSTDTIYSSNLSLYHSHSKTLSDISKQAFSSFQTVISNDMLESMQQSTQPVSFALSLSESVANATSYVDSIRLENTILLSAPFDTLSSAYTGITYDHSNQMYTTTFPLSGISKSENENQNTRSKDYVSQSESHTRITYTSNSLQNSEYQTIMDTLADTSFQPLLFSESHVHSTISTTLTEERLHSVNFSLSSSAVSDFYTDANLISTRMSQLNLPSSTSQDNVIMKDHSSNLLSSTIFPSYEISPSAYMNTKQTLSLPLQPYNTGIEQSPNSSLRTNSTSLTEKLEMSTDNMKMSQSSITRITDASISPTKTETCQESLNTVEVMSVPDIDSSTSAQINTIRIETSIQTYPSWEASPTFSSLSTPFEKTKDSFILSSALSFSESKAFQNSEVSTKVTQTIDTRNTLIRQTPSMSPKLSSEIPTTKSFTRVEPEKSASTQEKDTIVNIGIGVGVGGGFILIIIILFVIVRLRNRAKRDRRDLTQIRLPPELFMRRNL